MRNMLAISSYRCPEKSTLRRGGICKMRRAMGKRLYSPMAQLIMNFHRRTHLSNSWYRRLFVWVLVLFPRFIFAPRMLFNVKCGAFPRPVYFYSGSKWHVLLGCNLLRGRGMFGTEFLFYLPFFSLQLRRNRMQPNHQHENTSGDDGLVVSGPQLMTCVRVRGSERERRRESAAGLPGVVRGSIKW